MNKSKVLKKIRDIKRTKILKKLTSEWEERQNEFIEYCIEWLLIARNIIKSTKTKTVIFYKDNDVPNEYFEKLIKYEKNTLEKLKD